MRHHICRLALLSTIACASRTAGPAPVIVNEPRDALLTELRGRVTTAGEAIVRDSIAATPAQVHRALVVAFGELGIPVEVGDPATGQVANTQFRVSRQLAGERLSRFLSCGETLTGPRADTDRVLMALVSTVKPVGDGASRVESRVVAVASDVGGTGGKLACTSTGELEQRIHKEVRRALGQ
jgi:hypothetical protein